MISGLFLLSLRRLLCHDICNGPELQPPLVTRALKLQVCHAVEVAHIMKVEFPVLQADETAGGIALCTLIDQMLEAQPCQACRLDAVKRGGVAALLQMSVAAHAVPITPTGRQGRFVDAGQNGPGFAARPLSGLRVCTSSPYSAVVTPAVFVQGNESGLTG